MRIAFLSDVHANLPALESAVAMAEERGAQRFIIAGDVVGAGPFPSETIARLRSDERFEVIRGNVDRAVVKLTRKKERRKLEKRAQKKGKRANRAWTALALTNEDREWLASRPTQLAFEVEGSEVLVVHGSPRADTEYVYPSLTPDGLRQILVDYRGPEPSVLVTGHSHVPFAARVDGTLVVNCGSVGRPADADPRGAFALADLRRGREASAEIVRFAYPVEEIAKAVERLGVPGVRAEEYRQGVKG